MEKFSLFPSFVSQSTFSPPSKPSNLTAIEPLFKNGSEDVFSKNPPDFSQKEALLNSLLSDNDEESNELEPTPKKINEGKENAPHAIFRSPNAMLNVLSLHEKKASKIKGK